MRESGRLPVETAGAAAAPPDEPPDAAGRPDRPSLPSRLMLRARSPAISCGATDRQKLSQTMVVPIKRLQHTPCMVSRRTTVSGLSAATTNNLGLLAPTWTLYRLFAR